jgi:nucleoside-diphosphate-sugar epimerase
LGGDSDNENEVLSADEVAQYFGDDLIGTVNCPNWQHTIDLDISKLNNQHTIYACTKLANEQAIKKACRNYKIIRIWDIR